MTPPDDGIGAEGAPERPEDAGGKRVAQQPAGNGPDA
jgi:hypothetical protein